MVAHFIISHIYRYPVETVFYIHFNKYPTKKEENLIDIKKVETRIEPSGVLYSRRIAKLNNLLPRILQKLLFLDQPYVYMEEESWEDPQRRQFWTRSRNLTFNTYATVHESSSFNPDPVNPQWTKFEQESCIEIVGLGYAGYLLEVFVKKFVSNGVWKSVRIMEELLTENTE